MPRDASDPTAKSSQQGVRAALRARCLGGGVLDAGTPERGGAGVTGPFAHGGKVVDEGVSPGKPGAGELVVRAPGALEYLARFGVATEQGKYMTACEADVRDLVLGRGGERLREFQGTQ